MDPKQKRTTILALLLAGVVGFATLRTTVTDALLKPVRDLEKKLAAAQRRQESLGEQKFELDTAKGRLDRWRFASLPPDPDTAQRLYREWVAELARQCGFGGSTFDVVPGGRPNPKGFVVVNIDVKNAEASLEELSRFLFLFEQADLMQRIASINIESTGAKGNPDLKINMAIEGIIIEKVAKRSELFPRSQVATAINDSSSELAVTSKEGFPEEFPFVIKLDRENQQEYMLVEAATDTGWKIQRGYYQSKKSAHGANAIVELLPVNWDRKDKTPESYGDFVKASMFVIPSPPKTYNPRLAGVSDQTVKPGQAVSLTAKAENFDPEKGEPVFALKDAAEGMTIDPKTGAFSWQPAETTAAGKYTATVLLTQTGNPDVKLESKLSITIKSSNVAPVLALPESAIVILDRPFSVQPTATDDGAATSLTFSLGSGSPEGLTIDSKTGKIDWTPPRTFTPGKYDVEVKVTDSGDEPKTDSKKISLDVQDDNAALTVLAAVLGKDDVLYAWFRNKGKNTTDKLKTGDHVKVAEIDAEIASINNRFVTLKDAQGLWKLELGNTVRDRKLVEAAKPEATTPTTTEAEKSDATQSESKPDSTDGNGNVESGVKSPGPTEPAANPAAPKSEATPDASPASAPN